MQKTLSRRVLACGIFFVGASTAAYAQLQSGLYGSTNPGNIEQTLPISLAADAKYEVGAFPLFPPELASGDGQQETLSFCSQCHSTRYMTMQPPLPAVTWEAEVNKMIKTFGASIPEGSAKKIILYLQQNYTAETRQR